MKKHLSGTTKNLKINPLESCSIHTCLSVKRALTSTCMLAHDIFNKLCWDVFTAQIHLIILTKIKILVLKLQATRAIVDSVKSESLTTIPTTVEFSASTQSSLQPGTYLPSGQKGLSEILRGKQESGRVYFNNYALETSSLPAASPFVLASKMNPEITKEKKSWAIFSLIYSANNYDNGVSSTSMILIAIVCEPHR